MREFIERLGRLKTIIFITLITVISSYWLTSLLYTLTDLSMSSTNKWVVIAVTGIITLAVATPLIALLFQLIKLEHKHRVLATYDAVTGLLSRRALIAQANKVLSLAQRTHSSVSLLFIDLDDYKTINDTHGHIIGDKILRHIGRHINGIKRHSDLAARYGGDELIALLPNTHKKGAQHFAQKLHAVLQAAPLSTDTHTIPITISIGTATYTPSADLIKVDELIRQADLALYHAKKQGKNRTASYLTDDGFESR